eukprot:29751_1
MGLHGEELHIQTAKEEATLCTKDEQEWCRRAIESLPANQREKYNACPLDVLQVVRGFANDKDREKETFEAIAKIAAWREKVGYYDYFEGMHPSARSFYNSWPEYIYGFDEFGHMLQGLRVEEVDCDHLTTFPDEDIEKMQGQKMKAYSVYKQDASIKAGVQRYKAILVVDLTNVSLNMLRGKKGQVCQKIFSLGGTYYPESMWQIYLVNSPMIFRAVWAMVKPWLHPITVNKIQIIGSAKEAIKQMNKQHIPTSAIPKWMGGECEGKSTYD